jgi:hypothetical protein
MYGPYPRFANPLTQLDAAAKNPLGFVYSPPWGSYPNSAVFSTTAGNSTKGYGAPPVFKYVYFYDSAALTGTAQVAPAPVYWIDESFTTVTPNAADAFFTTAGAMIAGYWMPNTTALGTSQTAAQWYLQFVQSYGWIQIGGFLPGALGPSAGTAGVGNYIYGAATGSWASTGGTTVAANSRIAGMQLTAVASTVCDVLVNGLGTFWGS